jgi:PKD repeat protein
MSRLRAIVAAVGVAALLVLAPGALAAPPWSAPIDLSQPSTAVGSIEIAMSGAGDAAVIWRRFDGSNQIVQVSRRVPGGAFEAPIDLSTAEADAFQPRVAIDADGTVVAVWVQEGNPDDILMAAVAPRGGSFGTPVEVSDPGQDAVRTSVARASDETIVAWASDDGVVRTAIGPAGRPFGDPQTISPPGGVPVGLRLAASAAGEAIAIWKHGTNILGALRPAGGDFASHFMLDSDPTADSPSVAVAPSGDLTIVWTRSDGRHRIVRSAARIAGDFVAGDDAVSEPGANASTPVVAVDASNDAVAAWDRPVGSDRRVQAALRLPGGRFDTPIDLSPSGVDGSVSALAMNPAGDAVVTWTPESTLDPFLATTRPAGGSFGEPVAISASGEIAEAKVAIDDEGSAVAIWRESEGATERVRAAVLDVAAPRLSGVSIPATGVVGAPVSFGAAAFDVWSPFALAWTFGDGGSATGGNASHTYATAGTFEVRVTATDAAGRAATTTGQIAIASSAVGGGGAVTGLRLTPTAFRAARRGGAVASARRRRVPIGTRIAFQLDAAGTVRFATRRLAPGRLVGGRCVKPTRRNRSARACTRTGAPRSFTRASTAGANSFRFTGRVGGRALAPGRYRLVATPTVGGLPGISARATFRILPPARPAR